MGFTLSKDDTKAKLIDPKLKKAGWSEDRIRRNVYLTPGKIANEEGRRERGKFADYVLYCSPGLPIAVVEAKEEAKSAIDVLFRQSFLFCASGDE